MSRCSKCGRPKAGAHDLIRFRSGAARATLPCCWDGLPEDELLTAEEETADAETLRRKLRRSRAALYRLICDATRIARGAE